MAGGSDLQLHWWTHDTGMIVRGESPPVPTRRIPPSRETLGGVTLPSPDAPSTGCTVSGSEVRLPITERDFLKSPHSTLGPTDS